jgi:hypothetical protein
VSVDQPTTKKQNKKRQTFGVFVLFVCAQYLTVVAENIKNLNLNFFIQPPLLKNFNLAG